MPAKPEGKKTYRQFDFKSETLDFDFIYNPQETEALHLHLNGNSEIKIDDLRRVFLWKSNRVLDVSVDTLGLLSELAADKKLTLDDEFVKTVLDQLVLSQGIGFPMASAILKFIRPDIFPIIDVRAYRALTGKKPYYSTYSYEKYIDYAKQLTTIASLLKRDLREIDEQLYCYDEKHNGKI